ncbi:hypothetical protein HIM_11805 [Hirsutella minnesotensis 3608]|uniref:SHSP domain-containing protein n=1 Tax=Hirsutella minnesotensis 3608 TaxID=1043627 RepID=A0A0F7ZFA5_9HYPO|nr:hypothetical protein HIM_11805 [Hirsutella minnesotensis 3608]
MAFFPHNFYNPDASFAPLFRLLDEFDTHVRSSTGNGNYRRSALSIWQPKFDVRETGDQYELHGELPGVDKERVQMEFTEPQTMVVRGRVERSYTAGTPGARTITEGGEDLTAPSHHVTVEDAAKGSSTEIASRKTEEVANQSADAARYWLSERSVGEFSRTFSFPSSVNRDAVTASFKDGILSITVPKAKRHESRRITID